MTEDKIIKGRSPREIHEQSGENYSPKDKFELNYGIIGGFDFALAIRALKDGCKVCRAGWNGKGMWLALVEPRSKDGELVSKTWNFIYEVTKADPADLLPWIGMKTADEKFVPWLASQTDMLAEDWQIVE